MVKTLTIAKLKNGGMTIYVPKKQVEWVRWVLDEGMAGSDDDIFFNDEQQKGFEDFCERGIEVR